MLLVRAIESEDPSSSLLTREDRDHISSAAQHLDGHGRSSPARFLAERSRLAIERLAPRHRVVAQIERRAGWPRAIDVALPLGALVLGAVGTWVFDGDRLNLINLPLLGALAWNAVVYAAMIAMAARRFWPSDTVSRPDGLTRFIEQQILLPRLTPRAQPALARALARFAKDWFRVASPLTSARVHRSFHLAAAAVGLGIVLGIYLGGVDKAYRAGWESSILSVEAVHRGLGLLLGPASKLTGIPLPSVEHLASLNFDERSAGERVYPWMHLLAATTFLFIIAPRLVLAGLHAARAARLRRALRVPGADDFYVRTLLRTALGESASARVIPYSYSLSDEIDQSLRRLLVSVLGERTRVTTEASIAYGGEDDWLATAGAALADDDYVIILFNLAATPEAENHGALVAGLRRELATSGAVLAVVLDEASMRRSLGAQGEGRLGTRREAWRAMLRMHGVDPVSLDLSSPNVGECGPELEAKLTGAAG